MATTGGINFTALYTALHAWAVSCLGLPAASVVFGDQHAPRPAQPGVTMLVTVTDDTGMPWLDADDNFLAFDDKTITAVDADADTVTIAGHGLETGDGPVRLTPSDTLPGGLAEDTDYWVVVVDDDTIKFAASFIETGGGHVDNPVTTIDLTDEGAGTITLADTETTQRVGEDTTYSARGIAQVVLTLECHAATGVDQNTATSILNRVRGRYPLPTPQAILDAANVAIWEVGTVRWIRGHEDAVLFEPRAMLTVRFGIPSEDTELGVGIDYAGAAEGG